jgi:xanthine dehydrogenase accessory factor
MTSAPRTGADEVGRAVLAWQATGRQAALVRVARRVGFGSVPNGELLALNDAGERVGSVLAGSADDVVREASSDMFRGDGPGARTVVAEVHGQRAASAGLACGGEATLVIELARHIPQAFWRALAEHRPVTLTTVVSGAGTVLVRSRVAVDGRSAVGTTGHGGLDAESDDVARRLLEAGESGAMVLDAAGEAVLVEAFVPVPRLVIIGAGDLVQAITAQAELLGWEARPCADPTAASTALQWAGPSAALVVLSHDPAVDALVMTDAIAREVTYIGALGSLRTQQGRIGRLRELGVAEDEIARVRGPIGLDLGGRHPSYVALAICAEILASRTGRSARPLSDRLRNDRARRSEEPTLP